MELDALSVKAQRSLHLTKISVQIAVQIHTMPIQTGSVKNAIRHALVVIAQRSALGAMNLLKTKLEL